MSREEIFKKLETIFQDVLDDDSIKLSETTTSDDVEGWDSFEHVNLIIAIENEFKFKIPVNKVVDMENVGEMVNVIIELGVTDTK